MTFGVEDDDAFQRRRDELVDDFAGWVATNGLQVEPSDAGVALDWKWGYGDGDLATWTVPDLEEFLLRWCPRKLSVDPRECGDIPAAIGSFCTFLAARGLLGSRSSLPSQLSGWCTRNTKRFVTEMGNPANYGMAKGLVAQAGGLASEMSPQTVTELMERIQGLSPEAVAEVLADLDLGPGADVEPLVVGPVRLPDPAERAASATQAPILGQIQRLREHCTPSGRQLTQKGNLRLADARQLVDHLDTGDVTDGPYRGLRSAEDLPALDWLVRVAVGSRAVRRHRGRLVAVAAWAQLDDVEALDRLVDAAVAAGLSGSPSDHFGRLQPVYEFVDAGLGRLLVELVDAEVDGACLEIDEYADEVADLVGETFEGVNEFVLGFVPGWVRRQLDRLEHLGVVSQHDSRSTETDWGDPEVEDGHAVLTPAGIPIARRIGADFGFQVHTRPDPVDASAADIVGLVEGVLPEDWLVDATRWAATRDAAVAAAELAAALTETAPPVVLATLTQLDALLGEHATAAVEALLGGPHDGLAVHWLVARDALDVATIDPARLLHGFVDMLGIALDGGGADLIELMSHGVDGPRQIESLERLWRTRHPRTAEVLETIGRQHPDQAVAKAARKSLVKHRSWLAGQP